MRTSTPTTSQITHSKPFRWRRKEQMFHHHLAYVILSLSIGSVAASSTEIPSQSTAAQSNSVISFSPASPTASATSAASSATATITKAKYKTMYACEDRQLTMDCETGSKINLIRANFGRFSITQCNEQGTLDLATDCMSRFTFRIMQERCQDKPRCSVNATSAIFGDRCPTTRKYLEVHFQCLPASEYDVVNLRLTTPVDPIQAPTPGLNPIGPTRPPNNVPPMIKHPDDQAYSPTILPETTKQVINSQVMTPAMALNLFEPPNNKLESDPSAREPVIVSLRHLGTENVSRPRCYQWDKTSNQWTDRGTRMLETNQTHTICAFDQQTSYVLVMDYSGPTHPISPNKPEVIPPSYVDPSSQILPNPLETQPIPLPSYPPINPMYPPSLNDEASSMIRPPMSNKQQQNEQQQSSSARTFLYLLSVVVVAIALLSLTLVASSMRSTAGAALKSLGNFTPFNGPKYKHRRQEGIDAPSLHSNKDLLVINNSNGHSFIYAPASATKISSSSSTHILSSGVQQPSGLNGHQAGTLHRLQQQQMYSGNGATLSSLSGTGAQSNNYYYGLMGLNPLLQQQQQQHHFSQHHLNQQQPQQAQFAGQQHQVSAAASYNHQANKSSVSTESANSSASSSGVESGSTSMQQQQQARTQQACLVSAMNNNDFHLMGHHISNYGQHQPQQHNLFATLKGANVTHQQQHHQPTFTVNAHYSTSGVASGVQSINATSNQTTTPTGATGVILHNRQVSNQMRDHIYECVDDDKPYMARLLMPTQSNSQHQIFGSPSFMSTRRATANDCNVRQK